MTGKRALIFGIGGQDGAYLAKFLLSKGYTVHGTSRDDQVNRFDNLERLEIRDNVTTHSASLIDFRSLYLVLTKVQPDEIYNLAGQSSVGLSFEQPVETFDSISVATLTLLECLKTLRLPAKVFNACSSECYGNTPEPANEMSPFRPRSPYAAAKAAAFWTVANYREAYGLHACSGILFNHESPLRPKRFVTQKVVSTAVRIANGSKERLQLGRMSIVRDWGWAPDYVEAMWRILQHRIADDYIVATGKSHSLEEFVAAVFRAVGRDWREHVDINEQHYRPSEIDWSYADPGKILKVAGWQAKHDLNQLVTLLVEHHWKR